MSVSDETENSPVPGTVFSPRQVRILKVAVIVMGVLLVAGFALVLTAIVYQASHAAKSKGARASAAASGNLELPVPRGAGVTSLALDGDRLAVQLNGEQGGEIVVIDLASGKVVTRISLKPQ